MADDDEMYPGMEVYLCTCNITILHIIVVDILVDLEMDTSLLSYSELVVGKVMPCFRSDRHLYR